MVKLHQRSLLAFSLAACLTASPLLTGLTLADNAPPSQGQPANPMSNTPRDLPTTPLYRPEHPRYSAELQEARQIMDEMIANRGRDNFLQETESWERFRHRVERATGYIRLCDQPLFQFTTEDIFRAKNRLVERRSRIIRLRDEIRRLAQEEERRFRELAGDKSPGRVLGENLAEEGASQAVEHGLRAGGNAYDLSQIERTRVPANTPGAVRGGIPATGLGTALRCLGTAVGIISTLKNLYDLGVASKEYGEMSAMYPHLIEKIELLAYLEGAISQYDRIIDAQNDMIDQLISAFNAHACNRCVPPGTGGGTQTGSTGGTSTGGSQPPSTGSGQSGTGQGGRSSTGGQTGRGNQTGGRTSQGPVRDYPFELTPEERAREEARMREFSRQLEQQLQQKSAKKSCNTKISMQSQAEFSDPNEPDEKRYFVGLPAAAVAIGFRDPHHDLYQPCHETAHQKMALKDHLRTHWQDTPPVPAEETGLTHSPVASAAAPKEKTAEEKPTEKSGLADQSNAQPNELKGMLKQALSSAQPKESPMTGGQSAEATEVAALSPMQQMIQEMCNSTVSMYRQNLQSMIDEGWQAPKPPRKGVWTALLKYDLLKDGRLSNVRVVQGSGFAPIDQSAVQRVYQMQHQFRPIPDCYAKPSMEIDHTFKVIYR